MKKLCILVMISLIGSSVLYGCSSSDQEITITESLKEILMNVFQKQKTLTSFKSETEIIHTQIDNDGGTLNVYNNITSNIEEMTMKKDEYTYVMQVRGDNQYKDRNYYRVKNDEIMKIAFEKRESQGELLYMHEKHGNIEHFYNVTYQMYYQPIIEGVYKDYFSVEKCEKDGNTMITFIIIDEDGYWKKNEEIIRTEYPELNPLALGSTDYIPSKRDIKKFELQFLINKDGNLIDAYYELIVDYGDDIIDHQKVHEKISNIDQELFNVEEMEALFNQVDQGELSEGTTFSLVK